MIDPGVVGSPTDVATLVLVLWLVRGPVRGRIDQLGAGVVALARRTPGVDAEQLQAELEVDDRDVDAIAQDVVENRQEEV